MPIYGQPTADWFVENSPAAGAGPSVQRDNEAGKRHYVTTLLASTDDTATVTVEFKQNATVLATFYIKAGQPLAVPFAVPFALAADTDAVLATSTPSAGAFVAVCIAGFTV